MKWHNNTSRVPPVFLCVNFMTVIFGNLHLPFTHLIIMGIKLIFHTEKILEIYDLKGVEMLS